MGLNPQLAFYDNKDFQQIYDFCKSSSPEIVLNQLEEVITVCNNFRDIITYSLDGIFISDGLGNTILINKAYEQIIGANREELVGTNLSEYPGKYTIDSCALKALREKRPITDETHFIKTKKTCLVTCNPILDKDNNVSILVSNVRDLTEVNKLKSQILEGKKIINKYESEIEVIKKQLFDKPNIIASDANTFNMLRSAYKISKVDSTVLLLGETGVGKEEIAKYIHENSPRKNKHFIKVNCGAIAESLFESELFGYEKGSFTGARSTGKMGLFEIADKGTLFLDEIGEMPLNMQVKILRALQEHEIERVGGITPIKIDVRIIAATNRNLKEMVEKKLFREDLYYRLNVVPLTIPPLRIRKNDIVPLANRFLEDFNKKYDLQKTFSNSLILEMINYQWPGNVRELKNMVERATIMSDSSEMSLSDMPINNSSITEDINLNKVHKDVGLDIVLEKIEFAYLHEAYKKYCNMREASEFLGMKKSTFARKYKDYTDKYGSI